jgi:hypothetical protein
MGILAREGYEDQLTVAYISMMSHINDLVERHQSDARPTLVVTDEGHIITTNPLLARYVVKITKMWRKLGAWFWIATQNLEDFPDASRKMLNMMEWWLCLVMPKEEVEQIARFKDLTDAAQPAAVGEEGAWEVRRGRGAGRQPGGPVPQCPAAAFACLGHDREAREGRARRHHARARLQRAGCGAGRGRAFCPRAGWLAPETRPRLERVFGSHRPGRR